MQPSSAIWATGCRLLWASAGLFIAGCLPRAASLPPPDHLSSLPPITRVSGEVFEAPVALEIPTSFESLLEIALQRHPDLTAARARAEAARGKMMQAGLYPNPVVGPIFDELGHSGNALGNPGLEIVQTVVRGEKLPIARAAAARAVQAADLQATTRWFEVLTRVRLAYFELLTAQREWEATGEIVRVADQALEAARKVQKAGVGNEPDVLRAQVERDQNVIRQVTAQRRIEAARRLLASSVGVRDLPLEKLVGSLDRAPPALNWESLRQTVLAHSSEILEAEALALQAEELWKRARAENIPNVDVKLRPFYSTSDRNMLLEVALTAPIPIWNQNQGNILAAQADRDRARAEVLQVELRLSERLTAAFQRYQTARQQTEAYQKKILPQARESLRLIELGYKAGDAKYNYTAVLQAQQVLFQAQLTHVQSLGELWRAIAEIGGLVQQENWTPGKREK